MYIGMDKIDIYNDSAIILNRRTPKCIISWITILILLFIICFILFSIPFNIYNSVIGQVTLVDNDYYVLVDSSDFPLNKKLYIKDKCYRYKIIKKDSNILLKLDLDDSLKLNNNIILMHTQSDRTTVFKILKEKIKKGVKK